MVNVVVVADVGNDDEEEDNVVAVSVVNVTVGGVDHLVDDVVTAVKSLRKSHHLQGHTFRIVRMVVFTSDHQTFCSLFKVKHAMGVLIMT